MKSRLNLTEVERTRCYGIVSKHRAEMLHKLMNGDLTARQKVYMRRVIHLLTKIGDEILEVDKLELKIATGGFTPDEMERARAIIDEQNTNPFEGDLR